MASTSLSPDPVELYLSQLGTPHSRATARSALRTIARALGVETIPWASLTYADFARIRAGLGRLSIPWGNACLSVLRRFEVEGRRVGVLDAALVDDVLSLPRLRGTSGRLGRDIDSDEIQALFDACDPDTVVGRRDRALLALLVYGALRRSECAAVNVADVDLAGRVLTVLAGKGRKSRRVPLPRAASAILGEWRDGSPYGDGPLLRSVDRWGNIGARLTSDAVVFVLERLCDRAGIERASAHAFRAHRLSTLLDAGDPMLAQRFAGHSSLTTTIYDRRGDDPLAELVDRIAVVQSGRDSDQSSLQASTVCLPSEIRNTATCPNEAPIALAS